MDVEVSLSESDLGALGAFILRREAEYRKERVRRTALRAAVVLACATVAVFFFQGQDALLAALRVIGAFVVLMGLYLTVIYLGGRASATKRVNRIIDSKEMAAAARRRYRLSETGIAYQGEAGAGRAVWKDIAEIADTDESIFIFANAQHPYVLPRRAFRNEQEAVQFLRLARDYHGREFGTGNV